MADVYAEIIQGITAVYYSGSSGYDSAGAGFGYGYPYDGTTFPYNPTPLTIINPYTGSTTLLNGGSITDSSGTIFYAQSYGIPILMSQNPTPTQGSTVYSGQNIGADVISNYTYGEFYLTGVVGAIIVAASAPKNGPITDFNLSESYTISFPAHPEYNYNGTGTIDLYYFSSTWVDLGPAPSLTLIVSPASQSAAISLTKNATGAITNAPQTGSIQFTDTDPTTKPSGVIQSQTVTATDALGNAIQLTPAQISALEADFLIAPAAGNTNNGSINWTYNPDGMALTFLTGGEVATVTSAVDVTDQDGNSQVATVAVAVTDPNGILFTTGADTVRFDNLTPSQQDAIAAGANYYLGLGGSDFVTLPNTNSFSAGNGQTLTWSSTTPFQTGSKFGDVYTVNGGGGNYDVQLGAGSDTVTIGGNGVITGGNGNSTIRLGAGADTVNITGSGDNLILGGGGTATVFVAGTDGIDAFHGDLNGVANVSAGATLDIQGALNGDATIGSGSFLELGGSTQGTITFASSTSFGGSTGTLEIDSGATLASIIHGFAVGDTIDLKGLPFYPLNGYTILETGIGQSNNILDVVENGVDFKLEFDPSQNFSGGAFSLSSDGGTGTEVHYNNVQATGYSTSAVSVGTYPPNPYGSICLIKANTGLGTALGTGFIIGDHSILTAAHVVVAAKAAGLSTIELYISQNSGSSLNGFHIQVPLSDIHLNPNYIPNGNVSAQAASDFAVINVPNYQLSDFGEFALAPNAYPGGTVNVTGYSGGSGLQYNVIGNVAYGGALPVLAENPVVSVQGQSGGPLWTYNGQTATAEGLVSLEIGGVGLDLQLTPTDITVIHQLEATGSAQDGYLSGATVFADANGTGQLALSDVSTTTDTNGNFTLTGGTGPLIAFGGTDISTGLPFLGQLQAPAGSTVIDALTTVVSSLQSSAGLTLAAAEQEALAAFGLPSSINPTTLDPIAGTESGDANSAAAYVAGAQIIDTVDAIASAFSAKGDSYSKAFQSAFAALENALPSTPGGQRIDLSAPGTIASLIAAVALTENVDASSFAVTLSNEIVASNSELDQALALDTAGPTLVSDVEAIQTLTQGGVIWVGGANGNDFMTTANWVNGAPIGGETVFIGDDSSAPAVIFAADSLPATLTIDLGATQSSSTSAPSSTLVLDNAGAALGSGVTINDTNVGGTINATSTGQVIGAAIVADGSTVSQATIDVGAGDVLDVVPYLGANSFDNQGEINVDGTLLGGTTPDYAVLDVGAAPGSSATLTASYGAINVSYGFVIAAAADASSGSITLVNSSELLATASLPNTNVTFEDNTDTLALTIASSGQSYEAIGTISGFEQGDTVALLSNGGALAPTALAYDSATGALSVSNPSGTLETLQIGTGFEGQTLYLTNDPSNSANSQQTSFSEQYDVTVGGAGPGTEIAAYTVPCFCTGTLIMTARGARPVEDLAIGELLQCASGEFRPITWIGRRAVAAAFSDPVRCWPIRVKAGALGENVPSRDLLLSPDHALLVGDVLIQAGALVNGTSIVHETAVPQKFVYYHVELDDHSLILAENAPAETFIDNVDRMGFDNWTEHDALYPEGKAIEEMPYPRAKARRQVPMHIRAALDARAKAICPEVVRAVA